MATQTWPSGLPQVVTNSGYSETSPSSTLQSDYEVGPPAYRRRTSYAIQQFAVRLVLTLAEIATLEAFFVDSLAMGTLTFDWVHPRTGVAAVFFMTAPEISGSGHRTLDATFTLTKVA